MNDINTHILLTFQRLILEAKFEWEQHPESDNFTLALMIGIYEEMKPLWIQAVESYDLPATDVMVWVYLRDHQDMAKEEGRENEAEMWGRMHDLFVYLASRDLIPMNEESVLI